MLLFQNLRSILLALFALLCLSISAPAALADERILDFSSRVTVLKDGTFRVKEIIKVRSERRRIRRGIFRDFPLRFKGPDGRERKVGFKLISAKRDGVEENTRLQWSSRAVRIYLGKSDVFLKSGVYTYELVYESNRQLRIFDDFAEVYWNATGHFWEFPIDKAVATVDLPDGATAKQVAYYTGPFGGRGQDATSSKFANGNVVEAVTTRGLARQEGLTIAVSFDKQFVDAPSAADRAGWFFQDFAGEIMAYGGAVLAFFYYLWAWFRVGRDPPSGTIVPRWDMPEDTSPALVNYIDNKGLSGHGFAAISAAALSLAVKGYITIDKPDSSLKMKALVDQMPKGLPVGERILLGKVMGSKNNTLTVSSSNGTRVKSLASGFGSAMNKEHRQVYYQHNYLWVGIGLAISIAFFLAAIYLSGRIEEILIPLVPIVFVAGIGSIFLFGAVRDWQSGGLGSKISSIFVTFVISMMVVGVGAGALQNVGDFLSSPVLIGGVVSLVVVNVLFLFLLGAPTPLGRQRMDDIAGLKRYLTVAEKDRMNMQGAPEMSPQHFEKLLPYAVALGVEKQWSGVFQTWLAAAVATGAAAAVGYYGPSWYNGSGSFRADDIADTMGSIGNDIASSMTSAMPAPESSSSGSGGGGFSGGGGGGGGGGGW